MFKLTISVSVPELDRRWIEIPCPRCELETPVTLGSIRLGDVVVCRGCHSNIRLQDQMAALHSFRRRFTKLLKGMEI
jgi:hypothetical protein